METSETVYIERDCPRFADLDQTKHADKQEEE
jgi:phage FluMu protein Com